MSTLSRQQDPKDVRNQPCEKCGNPAPHKWEAWGSYLDKDLVCQKCGHVVDIWNCD